MHTAMRVPREESQQSPAALLETIKNLKAELKKKNKEIREKEDEVLRQCKVIDLQWAYIDSVHELMQRPQ